MKQDVATPALLDIDLHDAIRLGQLELVYQPQVRMSDGEITGMEALLRWAHPRYGSLLPEDFIDIAERNRLVVPIAEWVLHMACMQTRQWQRSGLPHLTVAVNLSALHFRQQGLAGLVSRILDETGLDPSFLDLEITRSLIAESAAATHDRFNELRALGVVLSLEDFGTGYSRFGHFMNFPLDQLKIHPSFVGRLPRNTDAAAIARVIVGMGTRLGVRVMAVGVENRHQAGFLKTIWCEYAQGAFYSQPLAPDEFRVWARHALAKSAMLSADVGHDLLLAA